MDLIQKCLQALHEYIQKQQVHTKPQLHNSNTDISSQEVET